MFISRYNNRIREESTCSKCQGVFSVNMPTNVWPVTMLSHEVDGKLFKKQWKTQSYKQNDNFFFIQLQQWELISTTGMKNVEGCLPWPVRKIWGSACTLFSNVLGFVWASDAVASQNNTDTSYLLVLPFLGLFHVPPWRNLISSFKHAHLSSIMNCTVLLKYRYKDKCLPCGSHGKCCKTTRVAFWDYNAKGICHTFPVKNRYMSTQCKLHIWTKAQNQNSL